MICEDCGQETSETPFCVRCGHRQDRPVSSDALRQYSADPSESAISFHVVTTLFPQLPRDDLTAFRIVLLLGVGLVVALAIVGFFSIALVAAAVLVPVIMVTYLYDVDVYEDEPLRVYVLTFVWGATTGALMGLALRALVDVDPLGPGPDAAFLFMRGVVVPIVAGGLALIGPLILLPYKRFNDVLDGATFGASSAVAFVGAQVIAQSIDLLGAGLRPGGDTLLWIARLLTHGVALPLVAAGAVGATCGAFWLRYRAPIRDRARLGLLGQPFVALAAGAALLVAAALAMLLAREILALVIVAVLAAIAMVWLRLVIHLGLLQESLEVPIGDPVICANCGRSTPAHTFCGQCGVSLRALPKEARRGRASSAPPPIGTAGPTQPSGEPAA